MKINTPGPIGYNALDGSITMIHMLQGNKIISPTPLMQRIAREDMSCFPDRLVVKPKNSWKQLPASFSWSIGPYFWSEQLRALLDDLEPSVHRFHRLLLITETSFRKEKEHGLYNLLLPPPEVDCIDVETTEFSRGLGAAGMAASASESGIVFYKSGDNTTLGLKASAIAGRHLWKSAGPFEELFFASGEFWDNYKALKLKGLRSNYKCAVVNDTET
jgi:hypothetical protein